MLCQSTPYDVGSDPTRPAFQFGLIEPFNLGISDRSEPFQESLIFTAGCLEESTLQLTCNLAWFAIAYQYIVNFGNRFHFGCGTSHKDFVGYVQILSINIPFKNRNSL